MYPIFPISALSRVHKPRRTQPQQFQLTLFLSIISLHFNRTRQPLKSLQRPSTMPGRPTHPHHPPQPSFTHPISNFHRRPHLDVSATRCSPASQTTNPTHRSPTFTDHLSTHCNPSERTPTPTTVAHPQPAPPFPPPPIVPPGIAPAR